MKRKHSSTSSGSESSDDSAASSSSSHHAKRRRFSQLERTLSQLSLSATDPTPLSYSRVRDGPAISELGIPRDDIPMIQPTNVIEPSDVDESPRRSETPSIPEVNMKYSSWYEPEPDRIVVTDLDASSDEEEDTSVQISPALMDRIRSHSLSSSLPGPSSSTQALVLYKPLTRPVAQVEDDEDEQAEEVQMPGTTPTGPPVVEDDDAMDIDG
ncbi:hypothetical protein BDZ89DRAFT_1125961 [Hymenopellis radicata]|nr:hypothetical protein BDZ89DRAFT_1125961 [Hymenopellis radicata]